MDIFDAYFDQEKLKRACEIPGVIYQRGKQKEKTLKAYKYNGTEFYAMYHPSQWMYRFKGIGKN